MHGLFPFVWKVDVARIPLPRSGRHRAFTDPRFIERTIAAGLVRGRPGTGKGNPRNKKARPRNMTFRDGPEVAAWSQAPLDT
jgi:hypothetical protein